MCLALGSGRTVEGGLLQEIDELAVGESVGLGPELVAGREQLRDDGQRAGAPFKLFGQSISPAASGLRSRKLS